MDENNVREAITKALPGIAKYLAIMDRRDMVDVSTDADFQRAYNGFYRVQRRSPHWYQTYYGLMEQLKGTAPTFDTVLDAVHAKTGRYEPSFSSKLVATLNPAKPVWDIHVLKNIGHSPPRYSHPAKLNMAKGSYTAIESWYDTFLSSTEATDCIQLFDSMVTEHARLTPLKKVDLILWQMRSGS